MNLVIVAVGRNSKTVTGRLLINLLKNGLLLQFFCWSYFGIYFLK